MSGLYYSGEGGLGGVIKIPPGMEVGVGVAVGLSLGVNDGVRLISRVGVKVDVAV